MEDERAKELMEDPNVWAWDGTSYGDEEPDEDMKAWLKEKHGLDWDEWDKWEKSFEDEDDEAERKERAEKRDARD